MDGSNTQNVGDNKAAIQSMGLRHAKKGSTISEAWEIIGPPRRLQGSVEGAEASDLWQAATKCPYARNMRVSCKRRVLKICNMMLEPASNCAFGTYNTL